jgi:hypothetical protein
VKQSPSPHGNGLFLGGRRAAYGVVLGAEAASDGLVVEPLVVPPAVPLVLPGVLVELEPLVVVSVVLLPVLEVEPVLLVGAVVLVPAALPLAPSSVRRLQADRAKADTTAAVTSVRRIIGEVERMADCSSGLGRAPGEQSACPLRQPHPAKTAPQAVPRGKHGACDEPNRG